MNQYKGHEAASLAGLTTADLRRFVAYGMVDRPFGNRKSAFYTDTHVSQLKFIRECMDMGLSSSEIYLAQESAPAAARRTNRCRPQPPKKKINPAP